MVYKNFSKYDIDVENNLIYSNAFNKKRILKLSETSDGYIRCGVTDDKGNRYYRYHQLVYCAVNGITKDEFPVDENGVKYEIDHIDNNKKNNIPENLRLVSKKDQMNNEITSRTLRKAQIKKMSKKENRDIISETLRNRPDESIKVQQFSLDGELLSEYPSLSEAARNVRAVTSLISMACSNKIKTAKGFIWKYA